MLSSRFWSKCTCPFKCSGIEILLSFILFYFGQDHIQKDFFSSLQVFRFWSQTFIYLKLAFQVSIGREALLKGLGKKVEFGQQCGWVTGLCGTKVQSNRQALLASFHPPPPTSLVESLEGFMIFFSFLFTISAAPSAGTCSPHAQKPCSNITKKTDKKKKHALVSSQKESIRFNYGAILPWLLSPADSSVARQHSLCQEWRSKEATMWFVLPILFFSSWSFFKVQNRERHPRW